MVLLEVEVGNYVIVIVHILIIALWSVCDLVLVDVAIDEEETPC